MYYIKDRFVDTTTASLPILDLGLLRGFAVFDYLRTYEGRCFHLDEHLLRLQYSAEQLGMAMPMPLQEMKEIILETKKRNPYTEASIKVLITGGVSEDQFTPSTQTHLIVLVYPLSSYPQSYFSQGISVVTTTLSRSLPTSKTTQYIPGIVALQKGKPLQAKEALYLNAKKEILEATTSNFFAFKGGSLYTCNTEEILFGITREVVLQLAKPYFPLVFESIRLEEIDQIEEAFITSSNKEIMPVIQVDNQPISTGAVGPNTRFLMEQFWAYTQQEAWPALTIPRHAQINSITT